MNNRFHSEAKPPLSYDYPVASHKATNKCSDNRKMPLFSRLYPFFGNVSGNLRKVFISGLVFISAGSSVLWFEYTSYLDLGILDTDCRILAVR